MQVGQDYFRKKPKSGRASKGKGKKESLKGLMKQQYSSHHLQVAKSIYHKRKNGKPLPRVSLAQKRATLPQVEEEESADEAETDKDAHSQGVYILSRCNFGSSLTVLTQSVKQRWVLEGRVPIPWTRTIS
jgi:hypothetical protein